MPSKGVITEKKSLIEYKTPTIIQRYTLRHFANLVGVSPNRIRMLISKGIVYPKEQNNKVYFDDSDLIKANEFISTQN